MNKRIIQLAIAFFAITAQAQTTIIDTVSTGPSYVNQIWYSLANNEVGAPQPKDNWDLGIEISVGFNSSILVNTQKALSAYQTPYNWTQWRQFDTAGVKQWSKLHNSDSMWDVGALNQTGMYNTADLGWGTYDPSTHIISGTRLFLIVTADSYKKLGIKSLANGVYTITYANIDNSDSTTFTVSKSTYTDRNFVYYSFATKSMLDREPSNKTWDLTFNRYIYNNYPSSNGPVPYPVTGILGNKSVKVAEVKNTYIPTTNDYKNRTFSNKISEIGSDWKILNPNYTYRVKDSLVYFVQDLKQNIWKVVMTGFAGGSTGNYILNKTQLGNLSVASLNDNNKVYVYPNPASTSSPITLITDLDNTLTNVSISITDINGRVVYEDKNPVRSTLGAYEIPNLNNTGVYFINLKSDNYSVSRKLITF